MEENITIEKKWLWGYGNSSKFEKKTDCIKLTKNVSVEVDTFTTITDVVHNLINRTDYY